MRLDPKRELAAIALARGETQSAAAREASVDRSTIARWLKEQDFASRIDNILGDALAKGTALGDESDPDTASEAEMGLARLVPLAILVAEAALRGEEINGRIPTSQMHANALKTIDLARRLEPKATSLGGAPSIAELIAEADRVSGPTVER